MFYLRKEHCETSVANNKALQVSSSSSHSHQHLFSLPPLHRFVS